MLLQVEADMNAGDTQRAAEGLASVLAERRARADLVFLPSRPDLAARFANLALERGIETAYVRTLIERHGLVAPDDACAQWPFRLRIRVLGGFELTRDGEPMRFTGKTQQRPLELLKFIARVGGKDVDAEHLMATLWPDADGAAAKSSFDSALFRLRKLLDVDNAIELTSGKVSLARSLVWTDVWALEAALDNASAGEPPARAARRLLDAYPGPLLGGEESPWIAKPRDALRARFVRALMEPGRSARARGRLDKRDRRLSSRTRSRQSRRVVLPRAHARARRHRRSRRSGQCVPPLPRALVDRSRRQAVRGNRPPVPRHRVGSRAGVGAVITGPCVGRSCPTPVAQARRRRRLSH